MTTAAAVVLIVAGMALLIRAGYLQYAALPEEHTRRAIIMRAAFALGGLALVLVGSQLLP
jgi:predicted benzoate:H+ symporter BenE